MQDSAMVIVALSDYDQRLQSHQRDPYPELREKARAMAKAQADFLVSVQGPDGSFHERYLISDGTGIHGNTRMRNQFFAIRALCAAWHLTGEDIYLQRAKRTWNLLNTVYWDEPTGLYRSDLTSDVVIYTPWELAAAYGGMREMILASPAHRARPMLERYIRFWVQSLDNSGMQMSEDHNTGEVSWGIVSGDHDGDGIPFLTCSHGKYGIAPLPAGCVAINIGEPGNPRFHAIHGAPQASCSPVSASYEPRWDSGAVLLPEVEPVDESYVQRETVLRWTGWTARLSPSKKIKLGSDLTGEQIFHRNCMVCHGQRGEGIFGFPLTKDMFEFPKETVLNTVTKGRFNQGMPAWGEAVDDLNMIETDEEIFLGNVLSRAEIDRVVDYVQTDLGKKYKQTETLEAYIESQESGVEEIRAASRTRLSADRVRVLGSGRRRQ